MDYSLFKVDGRTAASQKPRIRFRVHHETANFALLKYIMEMKPTILFLLLLLSSTLAASLPARWADQHAFATIGMENGMPHNFVEDIMKDSRGFVWIATNSGGICRYDSHQFVVFNQSSDSHPIRSNFVKAICEDALHRLWLIGEGGIECISIQTLHPQKTQSHVPEWEQLRSQEFHAIHCDKKGQLWLSGKTGLYRIMFDAQGDIVDIQKTLEYEVPTTSAAFHEDQEGMLFGVSNQIYSSKDGESPRLLADIHLPHYAWIQALHRQRNLLWIGTSNGLYRYDKTRKQLRAYHTSPSPHSLTQDFITDIIETDDHRLLISTLKGFNVYREETDDFERIHSENLPKGANRGTFCDFINCMLTDQQALWVGTEAGGLMKITPKRLFVRNYFHITEKATSVSPHAVNAIYEDAEGYVWVGTIEGGLNRLDTQNDTFSHFTEEDGLSHNAVSCLASDGHTLWAGTWGGGVCEIRTPTARRPDIRHLSFHGKEETNNGFVCAMQWDSLNQKLWIVTSQNIYTYAPHEHQLDEPFKGKGLGGMVNGNAGACIDNHHYLWLGLTAGLCRIDLEQVRQGNTAYRLWPGKLDASGSPLKARVCFVSNATKDRILVGTNGNGFYIGTRQSNGEYKFEHYTARDGLANNSVRGIIEDQHGNIWISTLYGLSCFDPKGKIFHNFTQQDGLANAYFYWNAAHKGRNGHLYFGSINGLSVVSPISPSTQHHDAPIVFTSCRTPQGEHPFENEHRISLHERDRFVFIEFTALDYNATPQATYAYRLKGIDNQWTPTPSENRTISFANLPAGNYTLEVRYAPDGIHFDNHTAGQLELCVQPYFYKTIWFKALAGCCILMAIYLLYKWRIHTLKQQKIRLRCQVEERTHELEQQKQLLMNRTETLEQQNALLSRQKTEILSMSQEIQQLTADKLAFFTNITHEFRTPLTLIIGPIQHLLRQGTDPETGKQLEIAHRNADYLLTLVNQLLDFRKVESGHIAIHPHDCFLRPFFQDMEMQFKAYAADKGLSLQTYLHLPASAVCLDEDALRKILINLMSNAIKFTPQKGVIKLFAATISEASAHSLFVSVRDSGPGIAETDHSRVFDRFYQSHNQLHLSASGQSGTGIGLYLCRQLVELQGGKIWVKNNRTAGCTFRFRLPLAAAHALPPQGLRTAREGTQAETPAPNLPADKDINLLIVEDNKDMREYLRSILAPHYHCIEASQGEEALAILQSHTIDFILSDLMMPVMDGMELSRRVKSDFSISHIPFLILTAKNSETAHAQSFEFGADAFLTKPFDEHLLLTCIQGLMRNRKMLQEKFAYHMISDELRIRPESQDKAFMDKVLDTMKRNYSNAEYGIEDFTADMGISRSPLYKKIQSLTGTSVGELLRNYRLNMAKEILTSNSGRTLTIAEVAYKVGFNDPKYFTRCFTKHFNVPPSKFAGE